VGKVFAQLTITNRVDEGRAAAGDIPPDRVRTLTLEGVLVNTGANLLCLPQRTVEQLGLPVLQVAQVRTAAGYLEMNIHEDAKITLMGRSGTFDCIALPDEAEPLLGLLPLERLGLEPDLQHETLRVLPNFGPDTYWTA
jgi:predicted aspartyl protease